MKGALAYLSTLRENNNRDWFAANKDTFEQAKEEVSTMAAKWVAEMNTHDVVDEKFKLFRIYRDVRFSKDKTPYKTSLSFSTTRLSPARRGGYYVHIEPDGCFLAGGFWQPNKEDLLLLRKQIAQDADPLKEALAAKSFSSYFSLDGDRLKSAPKGFDKTDPNIELLKYKGFIPVHKFTNEEVCQSDFPSKLSEGFQAMRPFLDVMTDYLTTNLDGESTI